MRSSLSIILFCALLAITGCTVGPRYTAPKIASKPAFGEMSGAANTNEPVAEWWREFHDPELDRLITETLKSNFDLQIATARIRQSRYQRGIANADLFPTADANASYVRSRGSKNVELPFAGNGSSGSSSTSTTTKTVSPRGTTRDSTSSGSEGDFGANPLNTQPSPFGQGGLPGATTDIYQAGFDASWEIDVFGGKRRQIQAATAEVEAAAESWRNMQVSLVAEVARDYLELRGSQERLRIAHENLNAQNDVWYLTRSKRSVGLASELDVVRAAAQTSSTASQIPPLDAECRQRIHALSTLLGKEPDELSTELSESKPLPKAPPEVPVGLPSQLLERRPDIKQAEREIVAANARIGSAKADLFPKFALIGNAGLDSSSAGNLFNWESRYFLISPTVSWRIFDAGRVMANIGLQRANEMEAELQYRNSILTALREVEDALANYATGQVRRNHLADELKDNKRALELARQRYDQGLVDFLTVLDAERNVYSSEDTFAQSSLAVSTDLVALYKSLGGGWK